MKICLNSFFVKSHCERHVKGYQNSIFLSIWLSILAVGWSWIVFWFWRGVQTGRQIFRHTGIFWGRSSGFMGNFDKLFEITSCVFHVVGCREHSETKKRKIITNCNLFSKLNFTSHCWGYLVLVQSQPTIHTYHQSLEEMQYALIWGYFQNVLITEKPLSYAH